MGALVSTPSPCINQSSIMSTHFLCFPLHVTSPFLVSSSTCCLTFYSFLSYIPSHSPDMPDSYSPASNKNTTANPPHKYLLEVFEERMDLVTEEEDGVAAMKRSVKGIKFGGVEEKEAAAMEIAKLAKVDVGMRRLLAELGVIPPLVAMAVESNADGSQRSAVEALIEMANGSFSNKKLIVKAGLLSKVPHVMHTKSLVFNQQFALLLLSISSLAKTNYPISSCHILPFLVKILNNQEVDEKLKLTSLATLQNLSTQLENAKPIATNGTLTHSLLMSLTNKMASEISLATLCNLVLCSVGKKAVEDDPLVPKVFIEILKWDDKPKCQELASYLLMIIAHKSPAQRKQMTELGIVPTLLEVALLGSPIARERALKLLQWFKAEKEMKMRVHSGPQVRRFAKSSGCPDEEENEQSRRGVKKMVKQSLYKNMEMIMRRANGVEGCSGLKVLVANSSSKSLPY